MEIAEPIGLQEFSPTLNWVEDISYIQTGRFTSIFLESSHHENKTFGRITFEKLDSIRLSRGEYIPYKIENDEWGVAFNIKNSGWLQERYQYEKIHYGDSYEFNGNVEEMKIDYKHLLFFFGEKFIETICRGFWYEESHEEFPHQELSDKHPFRELPEENAVEINHAGLKGFIYQSEIPKEQLAKQAKFCSQKQFIFGVEPNPYKSITHTVRIMERNGNLSSSLRGYFGAEIKRFDRIVEVEELIPYLKTGMEEIAERRKNTKKD